MSQSGRTPEERELEKAEIRKERLKFWGKSRFADIEKREEKAQQKNKLEAIRRQARKEVTPVDQYGGFVPTDAQIRFLRVVADPATGNTVKEWLEVSKTTQATFAKWNTDSDFVGWLARSFEQALDIYKVEWMKTGLRKMPFDFKHWVEMGKIFYPDGLKFGADVGKRKELEGDLLNLFKANLENIDSGRKAS